MIATTDNPRSDKRQVNKQRLEFLTLLAALELGITHAIRRNRAAIVGHLLSLAEDDGKISLAHLLTAKSIIRQGTTGLALEIPRLVDEQLLDTIRLAVEMNGNVHLKGMDAARDAAQSVIALGAMGVPIADVIRTSLAQAIQGAEGTLTRAVTSGETVKSAEKDITKLYDDILTSKITHEAGTQLNAAFSEAVVAAAETKSDLKGFWWRLSVTHFRVDECDRLAGFYKKGQKIPDRPHALCRCWLEPSYA